MSRLRSHEPIEKENIWELREEVEDPLRTGEKGSTETGGGRSRRGEADLRGSGEAGQNTLWFATSRRRLWWQRKSAPRMDRDTGAS